jgi:hypothetical protein
VQLDRDSIQRTDFPATRKGYDREAVDSHLHRLADAVEELKRGPGPDAARLAGAAADQVRTIVEAAERSAAEIAARAEQDANTTRDEATAEAERRLELVEQAKERLLERAAEVEGEVDRLLEMLRAGAASLESEVEATRSTLVQASAPAEPPSEPEPPAEPEPGSEEEAEAAAALADAGLPIEPAPAGDGTEAARVVALNMALNGTSRDETARYLADNFDLADPDALLDEVYARAQ